MKKATRKEVSIKTGKCEIELISKITSRACKLADGWGLKLDFLSTEMDITACHANGCPLKLKELLAATDGNFGHDVFGIVRHIDRITGQLGECFLPRYAEGHAR